MIPKAHAATATNNRSSLLAELRSPYGAAQVSTDDRGHAEGHEGIDKRFRKAFRRLERAVACLTGLQPPIDHRFDLGHGCAFASPRLGVPEARAARRSPRAGSRLAMPGPFPEWLTRGFSPRARAAIALAVAFVLAGCATQHALMPTPALYTGTSAKPLFTDLPIDDRRPPLDLLFITDRAPAEGIGDLPYGAGRSRSMAFGSATIEFGKDVTWDALVRESTATQRSTALRLELGRSVENGRFPPIPYRLTAVPEGMVRQPAVVEAHDKAKQQLQAEIGRRISNARRKEVVLFVNGYNSSFEGAALAMGELCHFLGREFVCGIFSWPAGGRAGALFGYEVDRESAEYATEDLVKAIRIVAGAPGLERLHLLAHSRGAATLASALAVLSAEAYMLRSSPTREFHIFNVVLIAPDVDADVALTKIFKVFSDPDLPFGGKAQPGTVIPPSPGLEVTLYVSPDDKALATAGWLSGSIARLGRIDTAMLTSDQIEAIGMLGAVSVIQVRGMTDFFGHSYFVSNPRVSSDIIAMLRYELRPNDPGRPLEHVAGSFWRVSAP